MDKKVRKRMLCGVLAAALLLSGCGRDTSKKDSVSAAAVKTADALEIRNDGVIRSHLENNRNLNIQRTDRNVDTFRFYVENTEAMAGFASGGLTTDYQESIQRVMDVAFSSFANLEIHMLACPDGTDEPEWEEADLNEKMTRKVQNAAFYSDVEMPSSSPLAALAWEPESPFQENALTVLVSSFIEPGNDLNVLAEQIQGYFDKYENSAVCLMGITSRFQGDYYVIPYSVYTYGDHGVRTLIDKRVTKSAQAGGSSLVVGVDQVDGNPVIIAMSIGETTGVDFGDAGYESRINVEAVDPFRDVIVSELYQEIQGKHVVCQAPGNFSGELSRFSEMKLDENGILSFSPAVIAESMKAKDNGNIENGTDNSTSSGNTESTPDGEHADDATKLSTIADLEKLRNNSNGHFVLTQDISLGRQIAAALRLLRFCG